MKRTVTILLVIITLMAVPVCASASFSFSDLKIELPEELKKIVDEMSTDELAQTIKDKLETFKGMSDEEIYDFTKDFCERYRVELNDDQIRKVAEYIKKATDFSLEDIKDDIDSVKTKASAVSRFFQTLKDAAGKIGEFFSNVGAAIKGFFQKIFSGFNVSYLSANSLLLRA